VNDQRPATLNAKPAALNVNLNVLVPPLPRECELHAGIVRKRLIIAAVIEHVGIGLPHIRAKVRIHALKLTDLPARVAELFLSPLR
jgi:hypothetical protein